MLIYSRFVHIFEMVFVKLSGTKWPCDTWSFTEKSQKDDKDAETSAGGLLESRN